VVVSVEPDEVTALHLMEDLGDHLVFSTDYPHIDSRYPEAVDAFLELPISDDAKRRILWDNCARFYSVDVEPETAPAGDSRQVVR
jgi:predicted TIM-barrel fold metal-dependent hydrolase